MECIHGIKLVLIQLMNKSVIMEIKRIAVGKLLDTVDPLESGWNMMEVPVSLKLLTDYP